MMALDWPKFYGELVTLTPKGALAITTRAALRVLPVLAQREQAQTAWFAFWRPHKRAGLMLSVFRACQAGAAVMVSNRAGRDHAWNAGSVADDAAAVIYRATHTCP